MQADYYKELNIEKDIDNNTFNEFYKHEYHACIC